MNTVGEKLCAKVVSTLKMRTYNAVQLVRCEEEIKFAASREDVEDELLSAYETFMTYDVCDIGGAVDVLFRVEYTDAVLILRNQGK